MTIEKETPPDPTNLSPNEEIYFQLLDSSSYSFIRATIGKPMALVSTHMRWACGAESTYELIHSCNKQPADPPPPRSQGTYPRDPESCYRECESRKERGDPQL